MWLLAGPALAATLELRDLAADPCGVVHGTVVARRSLFSRTVVVTAGEARTEVTIPSGETEAPLSLAAARGQRVPVTASWWYLDSDPVLVDVPGPDATLAVTAPREVWQDDPFALRVRVEAACASDRFVVSVAGDPPVEVGAGDHEVTAAVAAPGRVVLSAGDVVVAEVPLEVEVGPPCVDADHDGYRLCRHEDCDDDDATVHPGAKDLRGNGRDEDCDGANGADADHDGFEDASAGGDDCDATKAWIHPGATTWPDPDGDGATVANAADLDCDGVVDPPPKRDCAEGDPNIPRAEDAEPTGVDEDCDGIVDEGTVAYDDDGDGLAERQGDCDDADPTVKPGARETADCRDEDCDGVVDDGVTRLEADDAYDREGGELHELPGAVHVSGIFGGHWKGSSTVVDLVTRDLDDVERFTILAKDGYLDAFHVTVHVLRMGDDRAYDLVVRGAGNEARQRVTGATSVTVLGTGGRDDSGTYTIELRPVSGELRWCPVRLRIGTG